MLALKGTGLLFVVVFALSAGPLRAQQERSILCK
jgi:hypothetical protein